jgi:prolyl-tRNA synthetase
VNGFGFSVWKGIGVGLELGLRKNQQEALAQGLVDENPLQTYYVIGLSYNVGSK